MPTLSIIIPSFNSLNFLRKCVDSIRSQTFKEYEVLIIDAQSKDGTLDYLQTLTPPFFWKSEPDKGVYDAMNKGIDLSSGEWLYFLGSDDVLYDNNTLEQVFTSKIEVDISLIIGRIQYDSKDDDSNRMNKIHNMFSLWSTKLWIKNTPHHQGIFYRKHVFDHFKYDLSFKILSDYNLNLQLYRKNYKPKLLDFIIAICGADGISKNYDWQMYNEEIKLKTKQSSVLLKPFFYALALGKYIIKKIV